MAVHLAIAGDVFDDVLVCAVFFPEMSWMRSGTHLRIFLSTHTMVCPPVRVIIHLLKPEDYLHGRTKHGMTMNYKFFITSYTAVQHWK